MQQPFVGGFDLGSFVLDVSERAHPHAVLHEEGSGGFRVPIVPSLGKGFYLLKIASSSSMTTPVADALYRASSSARISDPDRGDTIRDHMVEPVAGTFDVEAFASELRGEPNRAIATKVLLENEQIRVWELRLEPGDRSPFHWHTTTYFFVCVDGGRARSRFTNGHLIEMDYAPGFTWYTEPTEREPEIHDLENVGESVLRFTTVELLTPWRGTVHP